uniref:Uncharacterized protein n=1 Tax=Glossina morsitans morsitans TaxID=37546 RepID=A0A1B0G614_GLOMM
MHKCSCSPAGATVNGVSAGVRQQTLQSEGYGKYESPPKLSLFMAVIAVGIAVVVFPIKPVRCTISVDDGNAVADDDDDDDFVNFYKQKKRDVKLHHGPIKVNAGYEDSTMENLIDHTFIYEPLLTEIQIDNANNEI